MIIIIENIEAGLASFREIMETINAIAELKPPKGSFFIKPLVQ